MLLNVLLLLPTKFIYEINVLLLKLFQLYDLYVLTFLGCINDKILSGYTIV